jgi:exodeoxyribonuclease VII small subunit
MRTRKNNNPGPECGLSFEQAIQRLEQIVADREGAELPLEEVLKKYEEGTGLVRFCSVKLDEAEKKIELLTQKSNGEVELKPFAPTTEAAEAGTAETSDEGRLL